MFSDGAGGEVIVVEDTGLRGRLQVSFGLRLPASIEPTRRKRGAETVECGVTCRVGLTCNSPVVEVELLFDNKAKDHRLRAVFPTPIQTDTVVSDGHFYVNHRAIDQEDGEDWLQPPSGTYPQQDFSLLQDGTRGLAIFNRGLPETAPFRTRQGGTGLALTLLRSVGWLSRADFATRGFTSVGPTLATPDAQCLGEHRFHYGVVPFGGDHITANITGLSQRYRVPVVGRQGVEDGHVSGGRSFLWKETHETCISAVKKHEVRDNLVIRLYNVTSRRVEETLRFGRDVRSSWRVNVLEERAMEMEADARKLDIALAPHEIVTVEVEFEE